MSHPFVEVMRNDILAPSDGQAGEVCGWLNETEREGQQIRVLEKLH